jgi:hypothetical protein
LAFTPHGLVASVLKTALLGGVIAGAAFGLRYAMPGADPAPAPTETPAAPAPAAARYVYQVFDSTSDDLYVASTDAAVTPLLIARIPHAREWGVRASVSPDGSRVAYTVMPTRARRPEADAEAWVASVDGSGAQKLAEGVDLLARPVWQADSTGIVVRRYPKTGDGLLPQRLELALLSGSARLLVKRDGTAGLYPIGFAGDRFFFAELTDRGTEIRSLAGGQEKLGFAVEGVARDWVLSPDGTRMAYLAPVARGAISYRAFTVDLGSSSPTPAEAQSGPGDQLGPAFRPTSDELTVGGPATGHAAALFAASGASLGAVGSPRAVGFDQPLGWSTDGRFLAVRQFDGASADDPGAASDVIVAPNGRRIAVAGSFTGWVK